MEKTESSLRRVLLGEVEPQPEPAESGWSPDLNSVALNGVDPRQVQRDARALTLRRHQRHIGGIFFGRQGTCRAIAAWLLAAAVCAGIWFLAFG